MVTFLQILFTLLLFTSKTFGQNVQSCTDGWDEQSCIKLDGCQWSYTEDPIMSLGGICQLKCSLHSQELCGKTTSLCHITLDSSQTKICTDHQQCELISSLALCNGLKNCQYYGQNKCKPSCHTHLLQEKCPLYCKWDTNQQQCIDQTCFQSQNESDCKTALEGKCIWELENSKCLPKCELILNKDECVLRKECMPVASTDPINGLEFTQCLQTPCKFLSLTECASDFRCKLNPFETLCVDKICEDILNDKSACETNKSCKYSVDGKCLIKQCTELVDETQCATNQFCIYEKSMTKCNDKKCSDLDTFSCTTQPKCVFDYDVNTCQDKVCHSYADSSKCLQMQCKWNQTLKTCFEPLECATITAQDICTLNYCKWDAQLNKCSSKDCFSRIDPYECLTSFDCEWVQLSYPSAQDGICQLRCSKHKLDTSPQCSKTPSLCEVTKDDQEQNICSEISCKNIVSASLCKALSRCTYYMGLCQESCWRIDDATQCKGPCSWQEESQKCYEKSCNQFDEVQCASVLNGECYLFSESCQSKCEYIKYKEEADKRVNEGCSISVIKDAVYPISFSVTKTLALTEIECGKISVYACNDIPKCQLYGGQICQNRSCTLVQSKDICSMLPSCQILTDGSCQEKSCESISDISTCLSSSHCIFSNNVCRKKVCNDETGNDGWKCLRLKGCKYLEKDMKCVDSQQYCSSFKDTVSCYTGYCKWDDTFCRDYDCQDFYNDFQCQSSSQCIWHKLKQTGFCRTRCSQLNQNTYPQCSEYHLCKSVLSLENNWTCQNMLCKDYKDRISCDQQLDCQYFGSIGCDQSCQSISDSTVCQKNCLWDATTKKCQEKPCKSFDQANCPTALNGICKWNQSSQSCVKLCSEISDLNECDLNPDCEVVKQYNTSLDILIDVCKKFDCHDLDKEKCSQRPDCDTFDFGCLPKQCAELGTNKDICFSADCYFTQQGVCVKPTCAAFSKEDCIQLPFACKWDDIQQICQSPDCRKINKLETCQTISDCWQRHNGSQQICDYMSCQLFPDKSSCQNYRKGYCQWVDKYGCSIVCSQLRTSDTQTSPYPLCFEYIDQCTLTQKGNTLVCTQKQCEDQVSEYFCKNTPQCIWSDNKCLRECSVFSEDTCKVQSHCLWNSELKQCVFDTCDQYKDPEQCSKALQGTCEFNLGCRVSQACEAIKDATKCRTQSRCEYSGRYQPIDQALIKRCTTLTCYDLPTDYCRSALYDCYLDSSEKCRFNTCSELQGFMMCNKNKRCKYLLDIDKCVYKQCTEYQSDSQCRHNPACEYDYKLKKCVDAKCSDLLEPLQCLDAGCQYVREPTKTYCKTVQCEEIQDPSVCRSNPYCSFIGECVRQCIYNNTQDSCISNRFCEWNGQKCLDKDCSLFTEQSDCAVAMNFDCQYIPRNGKCSKACPLIKQESECSKEVGCNWYSGKFGEFCQNFNCSDQDQSTCTSFSNCALQILESEQKCVAKGCYHESALNNQTECENIQQCKFNDKKQQCEYQRCQDIISPNLCVNEQNLYQCQWNGNYGCIDNFCEQIPYSMCIQLKQCISQEIVDEKPRCRTRNCQEYENQDLCETDSRCKFAEGKCTTLFEIPPEFKAKMNKEEVEAKQNLVGLALAESKVSNENAQKILANLNDLADSVTSFDDAQKLLEQTQTLLSKTENADLSITKTLSKSSAAILRNLKTETFTQSSDKMVTFVTKSVDQPIKLPETVSLIFTKPDGTVAQVSPPEFEIPQGIAKLVQGAAINILKDAAILEKIGADTDILPVQVNVFANGQTLDIKNLSDDQQFKFTIGGATDISNHIPVWISESDPNSKPSKEGCKKVENKAGNDKFKMSFSCGHLTVFSGQKEQTPIPPPDAKPPQETNEAKNDIVQNAAFILSILVIVLIQLLS